MPGLSLGNLASARNAGDVSQPARGGAAGPRQDARQSRARPGPGHVRAARRARRALARRARHRRSTRPTPVLAANAMCASAMWAANAATVSPAPDTADGTLPPDRRQSADHAAPQPRMAGDAGAAPARLRRRARSRSTARCRRAFGDEGAANHMRLAPAHGEPGVEMFVYGVRGGAFPARQHVEASQGDRPAPRARSGAHPVRRAVRGGDRRRRLPQRRRRGRQRARCCSRTSRRSPTATRWSTRLRARGCRASRSSRCADAEVQPRRRDPHPICSTPSW